MIMPKVDPELCIGCGLCADICPEVFSLGDDDKAHVIEGASCEGDCCKEAAESCPTSAITV
jgi:ferredoxin